jgi:hypothetical protein
MTTLSDGQRVVPIMSFEIEFDDIRCAIMWRIVVVIDFSFPSSADFVHTMSLLESIAVEMCWLPMANE